jgi:two-component system chemotaxis sensor kinase CheA
MSTATVMGTGSWGTAFAAALADAGTSVTMWGRRADSVAQAARDGYPKASAFEPDVEILARVFRDLHTIKGNSATYGFEDLTRIAHEAEDLLEALKPPLEVRTTATLEAMQGKLESMEEAFKQVLTVRKRLESSAGEDSSVRIPERKLSTLKDAVDSLDGLPPSRLAPLRSAVENLRHLPLERVADKYGKLLGRIADRLGKQVSFVTGPSGLEVPPQFFSPLDEPVMHILRNCIDHGIESPDDRLGAGKAVAGRIELRVERQGDETVVSLSDDGRGIDVEAVVAKAIEHGIATAGEVAAMSLSERLELIFGQGISTAGEVSDISGRGVGMSAVRECIDSLRGRIEVRSEPGRGTRVELRFPGP